MRTILAVPILSVLILSAAPLHAQKIVPAGTAVMIRLEQSVNSKSAANQKVKASVAQDVVIHGKILIPRGSPAAVYVTESAASGESSTPAKLLLRLDAVTVGGRAYPVSANLAGDDGKQQKHSGDSAAGAAGKSGGAMGFDADKTGAEKKDISFEPATVLNFRLKTSLRVH
ncbi:MAG: hypothetical protein ACYDCM_04600 [Candidatus Acidiferrales bacterium]